MLLTTASLLAVAERLMAVRSVLVTPKAAGAVLTSIDGRQLHIDMRRFDVGWLLGCHLPLTFHRSGLSTRLLPSLVALPRFLAEDGPALAEHLGAMIAVRAAEGIADLDRLERQLARPPMVMPVTRRNKAPLLVRLELAYPGLGKTAVARLLGLSHQGATKPGKPGRTVRPGTPRHGVGLWQAKFLKEDADLGHIRAGHAVERQHGITRYQPASRG